jgi:hypothetical protein
MGTGSFPEVKRAGVCRWPPTPYSAEVKERVELYLYSPSGPSWPVTGCTVPLPLPSKSHCISPQFSATDHLYVSYRKANKYRPMEIPGKWVQLCDGGRNLSLFSVRRYYGGKVGRVCEFMNSKTSILDRRELPAFRADGLCVGIFEKHNESENRISIVQNMNNSKASIEDSVCS